MHPDGLMLGRREACRAPLSEDSCQQKDQWLWQLLAPRPAARAQKLWGPPSPPSPPEHGLQGRARRCPKPAAAQPGAGGNGSGSSCSAPWSPLLAQRMDPETGAPPSWAGGCRRPAWVCGRTALRCPTTGMAREHAAPF
jgi:hypothetical protein